MERSSLKKVGLPDAPGVYCFRKDKRILYIGRATSLADRVRSYFSPDLIVTRGPLLVDMVSTADTVTYEVCDSVLEALILEVNLIKKHQPRFNTKEKDNKSFNYVVITNELFPKVLVMRGRELELRDSKLYKATFGPYPNGTALTEALRIVRRIFPYRDKCEVGQGRPCFNRQIGLCPGVCTREILPEAYAQSIKHISLLFSGRKTTLAETLRREMMRLADEELFEQADAVKRTIFALEHINDVPLIREDEAEMMSQKAMLSHDETRPLRFEAFDVAHISGTDTVGVMTVWQDGATRKQEYRKFRIKAETKGSDTAALRELLSRRFSHKEWQMPDVLIYDGSIAQRNVVFDLLGSLKLEHPPEVVGVVKNDKHRPSRLVGPSHIVCSWKKTIVRANSEAHRFALAYHRSLRSSLIRPKKRGKKYFA